MSGLVKIQRHRYVSRDAGANGGRLITPTVVPAGSNLIVNASVRGELCVGLLDAEGKPIPGFSPDDCQPIEGDSLTHAAHWKIPLAGRGDNPVRIEFCLREGDLYGFDIAEE